MKVLVVGSGGREHALAWRLEREGAQVLVAPGNGGTRHVVPLRVTDLDGLASVVERERVDLTIVGPEVALEAGLVDAFNARELAVFGPTRMAAQLEWSKGWTKGFLARHGIPTARSALVETAVEARAAVARQGLPAVLKADGLASGKGVFVCRTGSEVDAAIDVLFESRTLGTAAEHVLVEECLEGPELSVLAFSDGERLALMPPARDYKRRYEDDRGPNTGGMGGYTWPGYATPELLRFVEEHILEPTLAGMRAEGEPYRGVLYAGLILTDDGPKVLEFNCRFGDPECQLILPGLESSLVEVCQSVVSGHLQPDDVRWANARTYGVVLVTAGYPEAPQLGDPITGLDDLPPGVQAFHAGTRLADGHDGTRDGQVVTAGGRVLTLVGSDREAVYGAAERVGFAGKGFRADIRLEAALVTPAGRSAR